MSQLQVQSWSTVATPTFSYVDESLAVNASRTKYEHGFTLNQANGLVGLNAQTINSYNSMYLTSRYLTSDIFTFEEITNDLQTITTPLKFLDQTTNQFKYIKWVADSYSIVNAETPGDDSTRFQLRFLSQRQMNIRHINNNVAYFLCLSANSAYFATTATAIASQYNLGYLIDSDGYLILYQRSTTPNTILSYRDDALFVSPISAGDTIRGSQNLINIEYNYTTLEYNINSSWVSYVRSNLNLASIADERSAYNLPNQYLITTSYNTIGENIDINFINLKNNISEGNYVKRGSILNNGPVETPSVDFRFYTSLNTGTNQERGNENIVLTYVFFDKDIIAKPGTDTFFQTTSSIHPYDKLNINDSKFVANGAYGSFAPNVSDNIKKLRQDSLGFNNGRYLCTWLSGNAMGDAHLWVDRYYYPDLISKEAAYTADIFNPSFEDPIDDVIYSLAYEQQVKNSPIFDKTSDFFLEPNTRYIYRRVSSDDFAEHISSLSSSEVYAERELYTFAGAESFEVPISAINATGQFTVSMDMYLKPGTTYGYSVLGNLTDYGFSVLNDTFITPIIFTLKDNLVYYYNTTNSLINTQTFAKNVKEVIRFDGLDNYVVVCEEGYVYNVKYDNTINKLQIIPQLSSYLSFNVYDNSVAFLKDTAGSCIVLDKTTLSTSLSTAVAPEISEIYSVYYHVSGLKGTAGSNLKRYDSNNVCYLDNDTIYKQNIYTDEVIPVIESATTMTDYAVDVDGNYLFIHNSDKFSLYNKNRVKVFTQTLSAIPLSGHKCEFIRQFAYGRTENFISIAGISDDSNNHLSLWDYSGVMRTDDAVTGTLSATQSNHTNYNYYINSDYQDTLRFKIVLENIRDRSDVVVKEFTYNYAKIAEGYVTLTYTFDSVRGIITFLVNGIAQATEYVDGGKYTLNGLFNDNFVVGATGFYNGSTLSDFLKQPEYYYTMNTNIKNLFIYSSPLKVGDVTALSLIDSEVDPLVLSIPCGQRNNIEEIIRYFKFGVPGSMSNHINIEVKNSGITNAALQDQIKTNIRQNINKYLKADVQIDDITFVDYSPLQ